MNFPFFHQVIRTTTINKNQQHIAPKSLDLLYLRLFPVSLADGAAFDGTQCVAGRLAGIFCIVDGSAGLSLSTARGIVSSTHERCLCCGCPLTHATEIQLTPCKSSGLFCFACFYLDTGRANWHQIYPCATWDLTRKLLGYCTKEWRKSYLNTERENETKVTCIKDTGK